MTTAEEKRKHLVDFLDGKVFDPILNAPEEDYRSGHQREMLKDVKRKTESEKQRFHESYRTAEEVKENFESDLSSRSAKKVDKEMDQLGLPTLPAIKNELMQLCRDLEVK